MYYMLSCSAPEQCWGQDCRSRYAQACGPGQAQCWAVPKIITPKIKGVASSKQAGGKHSFALVFWVCGASARGCDAPWQSVGYTGAQHPHSGKQLWQCRCSIIDTASAQGAACPSYKQRLKKNKLAVIGIFLSQSCKYLELHCMLLQICKC